jgi:hypothetical protein
MARNNPELDKLRNEIKRKHRNAARKVNRIEKSTGVNIRATGYDPRTSDFSKIGKYTAKQLIAYGNKLDEFNSRRTAFVAGVENEPISRGKWAEYKRNEKAINAKAERRHRQALKQKGPGGTMTVAQREAMFGSKIPTMDGDGRKHIYERHNRQPHQIVSAKALDRLIKEQNKTLNGTHLKKEIRAGRKTAKKILTQFGMHELIDSYSKLTDHQFSVLWFEYGFYDQILPAYGVLKMASGDTRVIQDHLQEIRDGIEWASTLPETEKTARRKPSGKGKSGS